MPYENLQVAVGKPDGNLEPDASVNTYFTCAALQLCDILKLRIYD